MSRRCAVAMSLALVSVFGPIAGAATLTGFVKSGLTRKGIEGVAVTVESPSGETVGDARLTSSSGEYEFADLPSGTLQVFYSLDDYRKDPTVRTVELSTDDLEFEDVLLYRDTRDEDYYMRGIEDLIMLAETSPNAKEAFREYWEGARKAGLSAEALAIVSQGLLVKAPELTVDLPQIKVYGAIKPETLRKLQEFEQGVSRGTVPSPGTVIEVPPALLPDAVHRGVTTSGESPTVVIEDVRKIYGDEVADSAAALADERR